MIPQVYMNNGSLLFILLQSRHEIIHQDVVHKLCSEPCFLRFCNMNNLSVCVNCGSHCNTPVVLKMKDGRKKLCGAECLAQFRKVKKY